VIGPTVGRAPEARRCPAPQTALIVDDHDDSRPPSGLVERPLSRLVECWGAEFRHRPAFVLIPPESLVGRNQFCQRGALEAIPVARSHSLAAIGATRPRSMERRAPERHRIGWTLASRTREIFPRGRATTVGGRAESAVSPRRSSNCRRRGTPGRLRQHRGRRRRGTPVESWGEAAAGLRGSTSRRA
jgi:hypothetical protein